MTAWLKVEHNTPDKPEIYQIAEILDLDPELVFAKIFRVWTWFDIHSESGEAPVALRRSLDRQIGVEGFIEAMKKVGWIDVKSRKGAEVLFLPNHQRHVGESAKKRAQKAARNARYRKGKDAPSDSESVSKDVARERERDIYTNDGSNLNHSKREKKDASSVSQKASSSTDKKETDYSSWIPTDRTLEEIKKANPGINPKYIKTQIPEFIIYAENHYESRQLQSKFVANVKRHFEHDIKTGSRPRKRVDFSGPESIQSILSEAAQGSTA